MRGARWRRWRVESLLQGAAAGGGTSFSAGVADTRQTLVSWQALLKAADEQLLAAKREGRNRVRVATEGAQA